MRREIVLDRAIHPIANSRSGGREFRTTRRNGVISYDRVGQEIRRAWHTANGDLTFKIDHVSLTIETAFTRLDHINLRRTLTPLEVRKIIELLRHFNERGLLLSVMDVQTENGNGQTNGFMKRAGSCFICAGTTRLTSHHVIPRRFEGEDTPRNLITLSRQCHDFIEEMIADMARISRETGVPFYYLDCIGVLLAARIRV